jgi:hypothetical protein
VTAQGAGKPKAWLTGFESFVERGCESSSREEENSCVLHVAGTMKKKTKDRVLTIDSGGMSRKEKAKGS